MNEQSKDPARMIVTLNIGDLERIVEAAVQRALANGKPDKLLYPTREAAQKIGCEESWLASKARAGLVPCRILGRYRYFSVSDIEMIIDISGVPMVQSEHDGKRASTDSKAPRVKSIPTRGGDGNDGD